MAPKDQTNIDWWTLQQVAERWQTSVASLRRMMMRDEKDPKHLKTLSIGGAQRRVHTSEILRHEQQAKSIPAKQQEVIRKPLGIKRTSILFRQRQAIREQREKQEREQQAQQKSESMRQGVAVA